jgi:hypothetical protein
MVNLLSPLKAHDKGAGELDSQPGAQYITQLHQPLSLHLG